MQVHLHPSINRPAEMPSTQWSLIARLKGGDPALARMALDELCRAYHYPLYCQIRRRGLSHHDAEDVLHEFLSKLLRNDSFEIADSEKGKLRSFLLVALRRFLNTWHQDQNKQQKREISTEAIAAIAGAEGRFELDEAAHHESPDRLYDRQWAQELMGHVMQRLRSIYTCKGKAELFETLRPVLLSGGSLHGHDSEQLARQLGMKPGTMRSALKRLLEDFRELLRQEILQTVENRDLARGEFGVLMAAFAFD